MNSTLEATLLMVVLGALWIFFGFGMWSFLGTRCKASLRPKQIHNIDLFFKDGVNTPVWKKEALRWTFIVFSPVVTFIFVAGVSIYLLQESRNAS